MSGISSIGGCFGQGACVNGLDTTSISRLQQQQDALREQMDAKLDEALESAGMDEQTRESLVTDLEQALEAMSSGGSSPPDREEVKQTIEAVFEKYGLGGEDVLGRFRPSGGPPPGMGPPPGGGGGPVGQTDTEDASQTDLLETLLAQLNGDSDEDDSESEVALTPQEMAERILDTLCGFDHEA